MMKPFFSCIFLFQVSLGYLQQPVLDSYDADADYNDADADYNDADADHNDADADADHNDADYNDADYNDADYYDADHNDADYNDADYNDADYNDADPDADYNNADHIRQTDRQNLFDRCFGGSRKIALKTRSAVALNHSLQKPFSLPVP